MEKEKSKKVVETPTEKVTETKVTELEVKKKRSKLPWILVGCFVLICFCCLCVVASFSSLVGIIYSGANDVLDDFVAVCDASDSQLESVYNNSFTRSYKRETSFEEFRAFYKENNAFFTETCGDLKNLNFRDFANGFNFTTDSDTATLQLKTDNGELNLKVVQEREGDWKIDEISID